MPLTIFRRGKVWHYRGSVAGRRLRGSTGATDKATAQRVAAEIEARQWKGSLDGPGSVLTFSQAALLYLKAGKSSRFIARIAAHWKDTPVREINAGAIRQAAITLYPGVSGASKNRLVIVPTQAIINHAAENELCQRIRIKRFPVETLEKTPATWPWVRAFMSASSPHLGALACFMFLTGARVSEALALIWTDLDLSQRSALIRQTKIGAERRAHLPPALLAALANVGGAREGKVFRYASRDSAKRPWMTACKRAGIEPLGFHACRHGFATACLRAGIDPVTIARLGGWKSPKHVYETYGHASDDLTLTDRLIDTPQTQPPRHRLKVVEK